MIFCHGTCLVQRVPGCGSGIQGRSLHLGKPFFQEQRALGWSDRIQRAAFLHIHRAPCRCRAQGAAFPLRVVISQNKLATVVQLSHKKDERRGIKKVGHAYINCMVVTPLIN